MTSRGDVTIIIHWFEDEEAVQEMHFTHTRKDHGEGIESIYSMRVNNNIDSEVNLSLHQLSISPNCRSRSYFGNKIGVGCAQKGIHPGNA